MSSRRAKTTVMRKRMRPISKCTKRHKSNHYMKDWISRLPDEILVSVLSHLEIREAASTCVLSKRWEHLWSYNRVLNFDASQTISDLKLKIEEKPKILELESSRYISWVNKVLESHRGSTIDDFRVSFCLNISSSCVIDRWVEFAIAKRVQRLEVDLLPCLSLGKGEAYTFSNQSYILIKSPAGLSSIRSLICLCFKRVNISGEILEYFLSNCPLLESLQVQCSDHLVNLKVFCSSLKFLEISLCPHLKEFEVCATSLVSFKYFGLGLLINMQIKDAFQLAEVSISNFVEAIDHAFFPFSSYFSQLETLSLSLNLTHWIEGNAGFQELPEFSNLKHLTLGVAADEFTSLLGWTTLINASPLLHKFKLQLSYTKPLREPRRKMNEIGEHPHQCLKEVELAGFVGRVVDLELAKYLIKNAIKLEKIIINRHCTLFYSTPWAFRKTKAKQYAKERAMELQKSLPATVKMEII